MEYLLLILLIAVIALLLKLVNTIDNRFQMQDYRLRDLSQALESLKKQAPVEKQPEKPAPPAEPVSETKAANWALPHEIPVVPEKKAEEPAAEKEKAVFHQDAAPKPVFAQPLPEYVPPAERKSWWDSFKEKNPDLEKFIGENLINKIGVLVLVLGISYFVKFAIDKNWINEPARVGIGVLCGGLVMAFAHKLRKNYAAFSSVLVAGAISIFYFTIAIAFHDYHLFNQTAAFAIMVVITGFSSVISLSYNRMELAVLSLIGGFAVPFMVSTGQGNYVVLFSYIAILDIGILALAYHKKWNLLNILSYVFTVLLFGAWLYKDLDGAQPHYAGALLFGFVFYFLFILIGIINNIRTKGAFSVVELSIIGSNTFLFFSAGMAILSHFHPEYKGLFTTVLAVLNLTYAWFLYKKFGMDKTAVYLLIGLTLTFATLAIPIQFQGHYITLFWAAEAALLMWLGQKSKITSYRFASMAVHFLMLISLLMDWYNIYSSNAILNIIGNPACIAGLFATASLVLVYWLLKDETETLRQFGLDFIPRFYQKFIGISALALGYFTGLLEVNYQAHDYIASGDTAMACPILYHLLFAAAVVYFLGAKSAAGKTASAVIAALNIVLFAFWFSNYAFYEHADFVASGVHQRMAFYLHYFSLAIIIYFGVQLYRMHNQAGSNLLKNPAFTWIAAFFIVYIASCELMLHGLVLSNAPVTMKDMINSTYAKDAVGDRDWMRTMISNDKIHNVRLQIIKTGFPILWGILAFAFLIAGIKKPSKSLRIIALALLGITILKLFIFDIRNASETGKIVAFILLGVLILIISFVYQKIKLLVIDDSKPINNESE